MPPAVTRIHGAASQLPRVRATVQLADHSARGHVGGHEGSTLGLGPRGFTRPRARAALSTAADASHGPSRGVRAVSPHAPLPARSAAPADVRGADGGTVGDAAAARGSARAASSSSSRTPNFPEARGALARVRSRAVLPRSHGLAAAAGVGSSTVDHGGCGPRTRPASAHLDTRQARHVLLLEQRRRVANLRRRFKFQTQRRGLPGPRPRRLDLARLRARPASTDTAATATRRDHRRGRSFQPPHLEQERALLKPFQSGEKKSRDGDGEGGEFIRV